MTPIAIIGGGVAGLAAANRLADGGHAAILIEGGSYPTHKVCGEFISPEALPLLESWGLHPEQSIEKVRLVSPKKCLQFQLPTPAGSEARYTFDAKLAERARANGIEVRTETHVTGIERPQDEEGLYTLTLSSGEELFVRSLIVGVGRVVAQIEGAPPPKLPYIGIKAHFEGLAPTQALELHTVPGGYAGVSSVGGGITNLTCLATATNVELSGSADAYMDQHVLPRLRERLEGGERVFARWMSVRAPTFGLRRRPSWPNAYFIGDAAGVIAPACGDGLAMALTSGAMAADHALEQNWVSFHRNYTARYGRRLRLGNLINRALLRPTLTSRLLTLFPKMVGSLFELTRDPLSR